MINDERYMIHGSGYRMIVLDLYYLFVENVTLARRLTAAKSEKDFLRLQKQVARYEKRAEKKLRRWGFPKDGEDFAVDTLEENIMKKYLTLLPDGEERNEE